MALLSSGLPETIADDEDLARFLTQSGHFNSQVVKPSAFLPSPRDRETSVSRHGIEPAEELWSIGKQAAGDRTLHGVAIIKPESVRVAKLEVHSSEPPPGHAGIRGWPWPDDEDLRRAQQKERALLLASRVTHFLRLPMV